MWPFTGKRIFGSRWWALAFVIFICWQVMQFAGTGEGDDTPVDANQAQALTDALNKM
jgi:hypothetical protein